MNRQMILMAALLLGLVGKLFAQGTAFSYQGQLSDGGVPANGSYDLRFAVYNAVTNGSMVSVYLTNNAVSVSNGIFVTTLNFGGGIFTGPDYWLDIAVRNTNVSTVFTALFPRQPIQPVPYAIFANGASNVLGALPAAQLTGTVASGQISGTYANPVNFNNAGNAFSGTFSGNGASLTSLNGSEITGGTVADARLSSNVAFLDHSQAFTGNNRFNGVNTFTNWANSFTGNFFGNGLVGWVAVAGQSAQAERDHGYMLTSSGLTTVTLPLNSGLTNGDIVRVSGAGAGGWLVALNSGQSISGNFYSYSSRDCLLVALGKSGDWRSVAASADGSRMFIVGKSVGGVQASYDFGTVYGTTRSWAQLISTFNNGSLTSIACAADGRIVYVADGSVYRYVEGAAAWSGSLGSGSTVACNAAGTNVYTGGVVCSGDGTYRAKLVGSAVQVSTNGGSSWSSSISTPGTFSCLAVSSDCTRMMGGVSNGLLYASANMGTTWKAVTTTNQLWAGAWMSPDGTRVAAATRAVTLGGSDGDIYYCNLSARPYVTTTNSICGSQGTAVELQYIGNGQFMPVSSSGAIWMN